MNTTTSLDSSTLRRNSLLFWCTLVIPVAIIGIGINFILNPIGASTAYGIPIHDPAAFPFMWVKGIRDIFSGLVVLSFLIVGDGAFAAVSALVIVLVTTSYVLGSRVVATSSKAVRGKSACMV
jgi:Domain of unknown function (DUF4267)